MTAKLCLIACAGMSLSLIDSDAKVIDYELTVAESSISIAGKTRRALTLNGSMPGPTLRFREGDTARIVVRNALHHEETSIHWHGLLVPNAMDGVPYLTTPPIKPGIQHRFEFPLTHPGTYWYHSHTGLQEQRGVYGSIIVEPRGGEAIDVDHDVVALLSDWTHERPKEVMHTLMRGSEWYSIKKGNAQSILGATRNGALKDYFAREKSRMPPMDVSDVAYDAFLINGTTRSTVNAKPGDRVRLRVINAGASTYFYLHSALAPLTIVAADGPAVTPVEVNRILIGVAETYDVIVTVPDSGLWEFRATAQDNTGHASLFIGGTGPEHSADPLPAPDLYTMDEMLQGALEDANTPLSEIAVKPRPSAPYAFLRSTKPTVLSGRQREITLRLTGDMTRYLWSFNGKTLSEESTIAIHQGEALRIKFINDTMMHHPLHLHGHFFRVVNRNGDHSPLKHTVDVPPMGTRTIEFLADEYGDWLFHCHLLYHMDAGMARVFSYRAAEDPDYQPTLDPKLLNPWFFMVDGTLLNNMTMGMATAMTGRENISFLWDYGIDQDHSENEYDFFWSHYFSPNLSTFLGYRWTDALDAKDRAFGGFTYRLPYMVETRLAMDSEGDLRANLGRQFQLTSRLSVFGEIQYDTNTQWQYSAGASYVLTKQLALTSAYDSDHGIGAGISFSF
ncbi:MAG: FtsP/CotA-like multicopper oxidase with cupredoxin domain [Verrucomicrobiales bacterium]|jgi:FtsP/CotA-like multicopper oxidase with cupredoxin domain